MNKKWKIEVNINPTLFGKSQVHPLVSAESNLILTEAYLNQWKVMHEKANHFKKISGDVNIAIPQENAIKYAGEVIKDIRSHEMNISITDSLSLLYNSIKPVIVPLVKDLDKYRLKEEIGKIPEEIRHGNEGYTKDDLLDFLVERGLKQLNETIKKVEREDLIESLRYKSKSIEEPEKNEQKIVNYMTEFIEGVGAEVEYTSKCEGYRNKIHQAKNELMKIKEERKVLEKDLCGGLSWPFDVTAGILENLDDKEFDSIKKSILEGLK